MRLRSVRGHGLAVAVATAVLALAVPVSTASAQIVPPASGNNVQPGSGIGSAGCSGANEPAQVGGPNGIGNGVCGGVNLSFIGPQIGQVAVAMGPTIIGAAPVLVAPIVVSNGSVLQQGSIP
ncbi:MAG: hypothetical protein JWO74_2975 [Solirubrobacterales bacterium]|jgi:hypothetical protein|nr:hypothetical protein [Solirubrobacterales bacterium]